MTFQERTRLVLQFDELIRRKFKADSIGYASKLGISRGSFFRLLASMREEFQAPIKYEKLSGCYRYTTPGRVVVGFVAEENPVPASPSVPDRTPSPVADVVKQYLQRPGNRRGGSML